jgi:hypothetical protein
MPNVTTKVVKVPVRIVEEDSLGKSGLSGCQQRLATFKMKLTEAIPLEPTAKDLASEILRLKSSGVPHDSEGFRYPLGMRITGTG